MELTSILHRNFFYFYYEKRKINRTFVAQLRNISILSSKNVVYGLEIISIESIPLRRLLIEL